MNRDSQRGETVMRSLVTLGLTMIGAIAMGPAGTGAGDAAGVIPTRGAVVNIVEWDGGELPPVHERSDQLPLARSDIIKLTQSGFGPEAIVRMVTERRFSGDVSADGLISLKRAGVDPEVLQAVSRHGLPPNRALSLTVELEFVGTSTEARDRYLYIFIPDGARERVYTADLGGVLSGQWQRDVLIDQTDPLVPRQLRRVTFSAHIPLKTHGRKVVQVLTSANPGIHASADIPNRDLEQVRKHEISYPPSSLKQQCLLRVRYLQDKLLPYKWRMVASNLECEWD